MELILTCQTCHSEYPLNSLIWRCPKDAGLLDLKNSVQKELIAFLKPSSATVNRAFGVTGKLYHSTKNTRVGVS